MSNANLDFSGLTTTRTYTFPDASGTIIFSTAPTFTGDVTASTGNVIISTAGKGLQVKEGSNAKMGTLTLNGTTGVVVNTTAVAATSRIFLTHNATGGTPGFCYVDTRTAGTSFTVKGTAGDTSTVAWLIVDPA